MVRLKKLMVITLIITFGSIFYSENVDSSDIIKIQSTIKAKQSIVKQINEVMVVNTPIAEENNIKDNKIEKKEVVTKKNTSSNKVVKKTTVTKKSDLQKVKENKKKLGSYGRLFIPSKNFDVAVYNAVAYSDSKYYNAQKIVDNKDSAALFDFYGHDVIGDHNYQGFSVLVNLKVGTKAYIKNNNGSISTYKLKKKFEGINKGSDLVDKNGNSVLNMDQDLIMYTCYKKGVMITTWEKIA